MQKAVGFLKWWQAPQRDENGLLTFPAHHWPKGAGTKDSIWDYMDAAEMFGFRECESPQPTGSGYTITLYYLENNDAKFTHVHLNLSEKLCKSKLGWDSDIEHRPDAFDRVSAYGTGRVHMEFDPNRKD